MGAAFVAGCAGAIRRWPIALLLWAVGTLWGLAFTLVTGHWLDLTLDASLVTRTLLKDVDANVLIELWVHHHESLVLMLEIGATLGAGQLALSIWLNAGVVRAVQDVDVAFTFSEFWRRGLGLYPVFAGLWLVAMVVDGIAVLAIVAGARLLTGWLSESPHEMPYYYVLGGAALLGGVLLVILTAIHDHARIYAARAHVGTLRAYRWAAWFVAVEDARALLLAAALLSAGGALWLVYQTAGMFLPATATVTMTISLLWGQVWMLGRALLRVAAFAAATELQAEQLE